MNEFNIVSSYIQVKNPLYFYISAFNNYKTNIGQKTFRIVSKTIKYFKINMTEDVKDLCTKNNKHS